MSANETQPTGMELPDMNALEQRYLAQREQYNTLVETAMDRGARDVIGQIQDLNTAMSETLAKMIAALETTKANPDDINVYRRKLEERLMRIQNDYTLLKSNTDEMETLRRIRQYEESKANTSLNLYMFGLALLCFVLLLVIFAFGRHRSAEPTAAMPSAANMMPTFT